MDIFCKIIAGEIPTNKVYEDDSALVIMDVSPKSPGHLLLMPKKHCADIKGLDDETALKLTHLSKMLIEKMEQHYPNCVGIQTVINYGTLQEVKHLHIHFIPEYSSGNTPSMSQEEFASLLKNNI